MLSPRRLRRIRRIDDQCIRDDVFEDDGYLGAVTAVRRLRDDGVLATVPVLGRRCLLASGIDAAVAERTAFREGHAALTAAIVEAGLYSD